MTFDEWVEDNLSRIGYENNICIKHIQNGNSQALYELLRMLRENAYEAAQPHWNYCKNGLPTEDGNYLVAVLLTHGRRIVLSSDYDANNGDFWEIDPDKEVIAWQPLPEAPSC